MATHIHLPPRFALFGQVEGNPVLQLESPYMCLENGIDVTSYNKRGIQGHVLCIPSVDQILVVEKKTSSKSFDKILLSPQGVPTEQEHLADARWLHPKVVNPAKLTPDKLEERRRSVLTSWESQFFFIEEQLVGG